jgi:hypothetical protein
MCEWEQECSDNPLLLDPIFARLYITERQSWLINKQSMCAKCKLQLGEHLISNQAENAANKIDQDLIKNYPYQNLSASEFKNVQK